MSGIFIDLTVKESLKNRRIRENNSLIIKRKIECDRRKSDFARHARYYAELDLQEKHDRKIKRLLNKEKQKRKINKEYEDLKEYLNCVFKSKKNRNEDIFNNILSYLSFESELIKHF
jgi:hypothetical protein